MAPFASSSEAKEYIVKSILAEAHRQGATLSEVERQMLYFTESAWSPPDIVWMQVCEAFDRDYNAAEYEQKIAGLIRSLIQNIKDSNPEEFEKWTEAVRAIYEEDHYLNTMIASAGARVRPCYDLLKLIATALLIVLAFVAFLLLSNGR